MVNPVTVKGYGVFCYFVGWVLVTKNKRFFDFLG